VNEKVTTMSKTMQSPSPVRSADASASAVSEDVLNRLERVEDDVSTLIGVRDSNKTAWAEVRLATRPPLAPVPPCLQPWACEFGPAPGV
jgi:hypothetical protein